MPLKRKIKATPKFNMSSLTDIIFLLLIFFMLTSSVVVPNALNLKLPGKTSSSVTVGNDTDNISVSNGGRYFFNGVRTAKDQLNLLLKKKTRSTRNKKYTVTIAPDDNANIEDIVYVLDLCQRFNIEGVLLSER